MCPHPYPPSQRKSYLHVDMCNQWSIPERRGYLLKDVAPSLFSIALLLSFRYILENGRIKVLHSMRTVAVFSR